MCAALYAAGTACSSSSPEHPPVLATGSPGASCEVSKSCHDPGSYCIAAGAACKYLECDGTSWQCPPDGGFRFDAGMGAGKGDASGD